MGNEGGGMTATTSTTAGQEMIALLGQVATLQRRIADIQHSLGYHAWADIKDGRSSINQKPYGKSADSWRELHEDARTTCSICGGRCELGTYLIPDQNGDTYLSWDYHAYAVCTTCDHAEEL